MIARTKTKSLDYVLCERIQRSAEPQADLKIVRNMKNSQIERTEAFSRIKFGDREAVSQFWDKYALLVKKMKYKFIRTAGDNGFHMSEWIDDYENRAFERFMWVICTVRLHEADGENNCEHLKSQWIIYQPLWGNLMSMNRDMIGDYIERNKKETGIYGVKKGGEESQVTNLDRDVSHHFHALEDELIGREDTKLFYDSWKLTERRMTPRQRQMSKLLRDGKTRAEVKALLGLSQKGFVEEIDGIKRNFTAIIQALSKGRGDPLTYDQVVERYS
jgi:hypothetical protein